MASKYLRILILPACFSILLGGCGGPAEDEAKQAGKTPADFPESAADYFAAMDGGDQFTEDEIKGRNTWMIWTGGNEAFWDYLANNSLGTFDLLKTISSFPCSDEQRAYLAGSGAEAAADVPEAAYSSGYQGGTESPDGEVRNYYAYYNRDNRFEYLGLMNEPGFQQPTKPDKYGLCLDEAVDVQDPFDPEVYGYPSGVLGLRLYPNPNFDDKAAAEWDALKYYTDADYYQDRDLVRPYRVGMACSFCHVSHHPTNPPDDPENPEFANLSGTIGAQYFWFGRIFAPNVGKRNFIWHILAAQQPGAVDTSFVPNDYILNPRAMNAVFDVEARLGAAERFGEETSTGGALDLPEVAERGPTFGVPHVLWDGADSVGIDAALTRVYINIGEYHEEWIRHINPIVGLKPQSPIRVEDAQQHSVYWQATQDRAANMANYLKRAGAPMPLADAPNGADHLQGMRSDDDYQSLLERGKVAFAENCARCHSSKLPEPAPGLDQAVNCGDGRDYLDCWNQYWEWTQTDDFKSRMTELVMRDDFLEDNYLSTDARIPVTLLETEVCSSMASNAVEGRVWDNFSSQTYKDLPGMGELTLTNAVTGEDFSWQAPAGGRGYQRVPSLIAVWSSAPFLHNNEIGDFPKDPATAPSTAGRMTAFDDAIRKLLWPETRDGTVHRTDQTTWLEVPIAALPGAVGIVLGDNPASGALRGLLGIGWAVKDVDGSQRLSIGPIPRGTPVNLIANINMELHDERVSGWDLIGFLRKAKGHFKAINRIIEDEGLGPEEQNRLATEELSELVPDLIALSSCPDFVVDRGHTFGADLPDADKEALIEYVKTF
ncbi:MAG: hypothetical protein GVY22_06050 [Gammaproteobacteria bacterium]|jgi:hypothetical protein|nr:hypothetical protein [Gammaproteobacteria bacterium]